jgi:hypothetical protein
MSASNGEETIFALALHLAPEERTAYLDLVCGSDGPLRRRLDALLQAYAASEDVLEKRAAPDLDPTLAYLNPLDFEKRALAVCTAPRDG